MDDLPLTESPEAQRARDLARRLLCGRLPRDKVVDILSEHAGIDTLVASLAVDEVLYGHVRA